MNIKLKPTFVITMMIPLLGMPFAFSTMAAEGDKTVEQSAAAAKTFRLMRASQLVGKNVENPQGENLGEIKDLVIDVNNERVFYAILEFGGFLGLGEKLFAYPVRAFNQTSADTNKLVLNVDKDKLKAAPGFARDSWPDWLTYGKQVDQYYGETVKLKPLSNQKLIRATELIGKDVDDRVGKDMGEIDDMVVNMNTGRIHYAVLEFDQSWNLNDKLISLPLRAFTYVADNQDLMLNLDKESIDTKRAYQKDSWPDINDNNYRVETDRYLGTLTKSSAAPGGEGRFTRVDANNDGVISKSEANNDPSVKKAWRKLDKDKDGIVSRADFLEQKWIR
jgi:sporulation protein YlmC with PRC-barrel domain